MEELPKEVLIEHPSWLGSGLGNTRVRQMVLSRLMEHSYLVLAGACRTGDGGAHKGTVVLASTFFFLLERAILPLALAAFTPKLVYSLLPAMSLMFYELLPLH